MLWQLAGAAFVIGLLGGVHCIGMCGGIAAALTQAGQGRWPAWKGRLGYNLGRIGTYALVGAIAGSLGGASLLLGRLLPIQIAAYVIANLMLVALGGYLAGVSSLVTRLETPGRWLWSRLQPLARRLMPADRWSRALALGAVWGWLPCGLVYTMLATALLAGTASGGALIMLAFGLGTLPNMFLAGALMSRLRGLQGHRPLRVAIGGVVAGFGLFGLVHAALLPDAVRRGVLCIT